MANNDEAKRPEQAPEAQENTADSRYQVIRRVKIELVPGYVLRKVGQAYMVMPTGPRMKNYEGMITLNETGAFLFKEMQKPEPTPEKLEAACVAEYGATEEESKQAVDMFIQQCSECGLFEYEEVVIDHVEKKITPRAIFEKRQAEALAKEAGQDKEA